MAKKNCIKIDVMLGQRYYCTLQMPLGLGFLVGYDGDMPIFDVPKKAFTDFVEKERPSLKGKKFRVELVTKQIKDLWRR